MGAKRHNPEKRAYRGRSYKRGGRRISELAFGHDPAHGTHCAECSEASAHHPTNIYWTATRVCKLDQR